jgi:PaaX-like protein
VGLRRLLGCLAGPASHNGVDQYLYYPEFRPAVLTISVPTPCRAYLAVRRMPGETGSVHATSALFDLYGDHLRSRGSRAPVAALVRLLAPLGITAPAVRTAVSRMARQGWLDAVRLPEGAGYELTPRAARRLDEAAERIYRHGDHEWDGRWHVVVVERVRERARRERLRSALRFLGYAVGRIPVRGLLPAAGRRAPGPDDSRCAGS